ncbi:hypothetical protein T02_10160 [Trichinella nativa]|uniref:Uncharacterized protein n=1 Tax=Trichinella nativa TaxID=6335 RepID=A0A0V1LLL9_9BILA|nr:hypothetical protein T02_10160 [Trichinella nativa]
MAFNCLNFKTTLAWLIWQSRTTTIETSTSSYDGKLGEDSKRGTFSKIYTTGKMNNKFSPFIPTRRNLFCLKLNRLLVIESTCNFQSEVKLYTC